MARAPHGGASRNDPPRKPPRRAEPRASEPKRGTGVPVVGKLGWFRQHQLAAVESLLRLLREPFSTMLAALVMGIALALPLSLWLLLQNLQGLMREVDEAGTVSIYLQQGLEPARQQALADMLRAHENVSGVLLITPEQALAEFERNSGFSDVLAGLDSNPLPPVLVVTPRSLEVDLLQNLQLYASALDGVELAETDLAWLQRLGAFLNLAGRLALLLGLMLG
ncbi:MAG: permease-like cell division protein FtsX, partial [Pseudomonadales bacterium]|nr:permease-like cell division protein FtsX [Pseudomonadales bacterium]